MRRLIVLLPIAFAIPGCGSILDRDPVEVRVQNASTVMMENVIASVEARIGGELQRLQVIDSSGRSRCRPVATRTVSDCSGGFRPTLHLVAD